MPRLGSESNSSVRRHNSPQTLSNYVQINSQVWQIRAGGSPLTGLQTHPEPSPSQLEPSPDPELDALDDLLVRTRASASRTRWNARPVGSPYGQRPLHKWLPSEQKHFEELSALMEMFPEPGSDDEYEEEKALHEIVLKDPEGRQVEVDNNDRDDLAEEQEEDEELESEEDEADIDDAALSQPRAQPHSSPSVSAAAAVKKRERNKKKKAKARAKAKEKMKPPTSPQPVPDAPQDLLMSMSRIAKLVGTLNAESPDESNELLKRVRDAFTEEGRRQLGSAPPSIEPVQWRAEVLQSVRRMESMLGQMEKWQAQVAPGEIEALREETTRLEVRVRAVMEQTGRERAGAQTAGQTKQVGGAHSSRVDAKHEVEVEVAEVAVSSEGEESVGLGDSGLFPAGANDQAEDAASVSDGIIEGTSCPSEADAGATELDPDDPALHQDSGPLLKPPPPAQGSPHAISQNIPTTASTLFPPAPASVGTSHQPSPLPPSKPAPIPAAPSVPPLLATASGPSSAPSQSASLSAPNQNIPPESPADPVKHLKDNPWSMLEVLFLLEVVAHFPPAEHGWTFIAEAYNNILITRPLQEWFAKQAPASNEEEVKMKAILQRMATEKRQMAAQKASAKAAKPVSVETTEDQQQQGQRGKPAPFGSAEARAEADDCARDSPAAKMALDEDAIFLTRLPFPIITSGKGMHPADNPANPLPLQRIMAFPRRRPPFHLASEEARAFARVMASAAAGLRPPSGESRAAMLALYQATKSRFPVRTAWDCWHRWCTPWIAQEDPIREVAAAADSGKPPIVLDYIAGNLCVPAGTWVARASGFVYRPIPGTYPDVPGVQRRVVGGYDPRPGMVAYARMVHLNAEKMWAVMGLKRKPDGMVAEEVLVGRRAKLPGTLMGIWPAKAPVPKAGTTARPAAQTGATQPTQSSQPAQAKPSVRTAQPSGAVQQSTTPAATQQLAADSVDGKTKKVRSSQTTQHTVPSSQPSADTNADTSKVTPVSSVTQVSPSTSAVSAPSFSSGTRATPSTSTATYSTPGATPPSAASKPKEVSASSTAPPSQLTAADRPISFPLPPPRVPPPLEPPNVPEGTLGHRQKKGILAWFERATVRVDSLERAMRMNDLKRAWEQAFGVPEGAAGLEAEERGRMVPLHLRGLEVPPVPPLRAQVWSRPPLDRPRAQSRPRSLAAN